MYVIITAATGLVGVIGATAALIRLPDPTKPPGPRPRRDRDRCSRRSGPTGRGYLHGAVAGPTGRGYLRGDVAGPTGRGYLHGDVAGQPGELFDTQLRDWPSPLRCVSSRRR